MLDQKIFDVCTDEIGIFIVAEMSTKHNLITKEYTQQCIELAYKHSSKVVGWICQSDLAVTSNFLNAIPGISLNANTDDLQEQCYNTPVRARNNGADILIIGRCIYESIDPISMIKKCI